MATGIDNPRLLICPEIPDHRDSLGDFNKCSPREVGGDSHFGHPRIFQQLFPSLCCINGKYRCTFQHVGHFLHCGGRGVHHTFKAHLTNSKKRRGQYTHHKHNETDNHAAELEPLDPLQTLAAFPSTLTLIESRIRTVIIHDDNAIKILIINNDCATTVIGHVNDVSTTCQWFQ